MTGEFLVRTGLWGQIDALRSSDASVYQRGDAVVCRTQRGVELGQVVAAGDSQAIVGQIIRPMSDQDRLLQQRLEKHKNEAMKACREQLLQAGSDAVLLDVEPLFDGSTLYFHFLTQVDATVEALVEPLSQVYESNVRSQHFARLLETGCGPGCGTSESKGGCASAGGCGTGGGCAVCVVASARRMPSGGNKGDGNV